jgi:hypothetical protein
MTKVFSRVPALLILLSGCSELPWDVETPSAGGLIEYRINETGAPGGADENSMVIRWNTDARGIWHDGTCPGKPCRTWREIIDKKGHRTFEEVKSSP